MQPGGVEHGVAVVARRRRRSRHRDAWPSRSCRRCRSRAARRCAVPASRSVVVVVARGAGVGLVACRCRRGPTRTWRSCRRGRLEPEPLKVTVWPIDDRVRRRGQRRRSAAWLAMTSTARAVRSVAPPLSVTRRPHGVGALGGVGLDGRRESSPALTS